MVSGFREEFESAMGESVYFFVVGMTDEMGVFVPFSWLPKKNFLAE